MTFRRGTVYSARFAPDGHSIIYTAAWDGNPPEIYVGAAGSGEYRALGLSNAAVLSISRAGEMAVLLHCRYVDPDSGLVGTLARLPLSGGAPREVAENVISADWAPDGEKLAAIRIVRGVFRLEYPLGNVLYESGAPIRDVRVSPKGDSVAFLDEKVTIIRTSREKRVLTKGWAYSWGLAWSTSGDEIIFGEDL